MSQPTAPTLFAALTRRPQPDAGGKDARDAQQQAAAKAARRHLLEIVRSDWSYDPSSSASAAQSSAASRPDLDSDVIEWRPREQEDTSCSEQEGERGRSSPRAARDPYRFENPDAVAQSIIERRNRRLKRLQEEMQWNEGLKIWMARRDAWTGAKPSRAQRSTATTLEPVSTSGDVATISNEDERAETAERGSQDLTTEGRGAASQRPLENSDTQPSSVVEVPEETLIPVVQPNSLHGDNARAPITPNAYSTIYSRLILQSNAPTVPLNLKHVTRALVHGWKQNGEWPPKPTPRKEVQMARRRGVASAAVGSEATPGEIEVHAPQKHKRSGSLGETMKKVFSLRPGRRFHNRNNSRDSQGQPPPPAAAPGEV
ncbi:hypothetical protein VTO42DRAFT_1179 [Malbranchea cinnamomea]